MSSGIARIVLVDGDGNEYIFGNDVPSIEYSRTGEWRSQPQDYKFFNEYARITCEFAVVPTKWNLTKINTANGDVITFEYTRSGHILYESMVDYVDKDPGISSSTPCANCQAYYDISQRYLLTPSYLSKISDGKGTTIEFTKAITNQIGSNTTLGLQLPSSDPKYSAYKPSFYFYPDMGGGSYSETRKLLRLDKIEKKYNGVSVKKAQLQFIENTTERLKLSKLIFKGSGAGEIEYNFQYNSQKLPNYALSKIDHWGYYNNIANYFDSHSTYTFTNLENDYPACRAPVEQYTKADVLEKIIYPTGGDVRFVYEANKYGAFVENYVTTNNAGGQDIPGGGLRITEINSYTDNQLVRSKKYNYSKDFLNNITTSSGILKMKPIYVRHNTAANKSSFMSENRDHFYPLEDNMGNSVTYSKVTELLNNGADGYVVHTFRNDDNFTFIAASATPEIRYEKANHERGLLLSSQQYNSGKVLVKETNFQYFQDASKFIKAIYLNYTQFAVPPAYDGSYYFTPLMIYHSPYKTLSYFNYLKRVDNTVYDKNGQNPHTQTTHFVYDNNRNLIEEKTSTNEGKWIKTTYRYYDHANFAITTPSGSNEVALGVKKLKDIKAFSKPIEKIVTIENSSGGDVRVLSAELYTYKQDRPLVDKVYKIETDQAILIANFTTTVISDNNFVKDSRYVLQESYKYDESGNLAESQKANDLKESKIWDYGRQHVACEARGAGINEIAYSSFETQTKGGWTYLDSRIVNSGGFTGSNAYQFNGTGPVWNGGFDKISAGLSSKEFTLSFWAKDGVPIVYRPSGNPMQPYVYYSPIKSFTDAATGWTYYQYTVQYDVVLRNTDPQPNDVIRSALLVDELRIYPKAAQMHTYCYLPHIGKTVECDINNKLTYYEYDGLNRLRLIRDHDRSIIKTFEYNVK